MKQQILSEAWVLKNENINVTLGACLRCVCSQFQTAEHKRLATMEGECALAYFNQHYSDKYELQFNLEAM